MKVVFMNLSDVFLPGSTGEVDGPYLSAAVDAFNRITRMTQAVAVVKSRQAGAAQNLDVAEKLGRCFQANGVEGRIADVLPESDGGQALGGSVRSWLDQRWNEVSSFVLLGSWDDCTFQKRCIEVDPAVGLTATDAVQAVSILNDNWIEFE